MNWGPHGISPATSRYYVSYISRLCRDVYSRLKARLDHVLADEALSVCNTSQQLNCGDAMVMAGACAVCWCCFRGVA